MKNESIEAVWDKVDANAEAYRAALDGGAPCACCERRTAHEDRWIIRTVWGIVLAFALVAAFLAGRKCAIHEDLVRSQAEWAAEARQ